jgi:hypothetical protein
MVVKFRKTIWPPPPQLSLHRKDALSSNSNGTRSVYNRENPKSSLYCQMSMVGPWKLLVPGFAIEGVFGASQRDQCAVGGFYSTVQF